MEKTTEEKNLVSTNTRAVECPKKSILVVDDSNDLLTLLRTILEIDNYEIFTAQSGKEVLKKLSEIKNPDLVILDVQMEDMSGPEFLLTLEETRPDLVKHVPVVFLTGMDQVEKSKAVGFIRKPIDIISFLKDIGNFIKVGTGHVRYGH